MEDCAKQEQNDNARPAYAGEVPDLSQYSTIFIGAPVWWGDWPMIMYTFFENNVEGLSGTTLIPFSTHEGSGLSGFDKKLSSACPDATVLDGLELGEYSFEDLEYLKWIRPQASSIKKYSYAIGIFVRVLSSEFGVEYW